MKRLWVVALAAFVAAGFTFPACAQRGGSRGGGFSAHSAPAFRGGSSASAPRSFAGAPRYTGRTSFSSTPRFLGNTSRNFASRPNYYYGNSRYRRPYPSRYGYGVPYLGAPWIGPGYLDPGYLDYPDTTADNDSQAAPDYGAGAPNYPTGYDNPPPYPVQPPYPAQPAPAAPYVYYYTQPPPIAALPAEDAVTLIFKDGRPPEQIHNYAMTRTMLYVRDQRYHDIPLDLLDVDATEKANHNAGVDFQLRELSR
jgi:hypothetical protein